MASRFWHYILFRFLSWVESCKYALLVGWLLALAMSTDVCFLWFNILIHLFEATRKTRSRIFFSWCIAWALPFLWFVITVSECLDAYECVTEQVEWQVLIVNNTTTIRSYSSSTLRSFSKSCVLGAALCLHLSAAQAFWLVYDPNCSLCDYPWCTTHLHFFFVCNRVNVLMSSISFCRTCFSTLQSFSSAQCSSWPA